MNKEQKIAFYKSLIDMYAHIIKDEENSEIKGLSKSIVKESMKDLFGSDDTDEDVDIEDLKLMIEQAPEAIPFLDAFFANLPSLDSSALPEGSNISFDKISEQVLILKDKFKAHQDSEDIKNF